MQFVSEIRPQGHEELTAEQRAALVEVANRTGFSVLGEEPGPSQPLYRIKLHVSMTNPYFLARLEERAAARVAGRDLTR